MVKRDVSFLLWFWLRRSAGVFLLLCVPGLIVGVFWPGSSSTILEKVSLLFLLVWGLPIAFSMLRVPYQHRRVESLRMRIEEVPLFAKQPAAEAPDLTLPAILTLKISRGMCLAFAVYWLLLLGLLLWFQRPLWQVQVVYLLVWTSVAWLALGGLVLGVLALFFYQRIEISSEVLAVQHGWRRKRIPWEDARLFAVLGLEEKDNSRPHLYELSSARTILRWTHVASGVGFTLYPRDRKDYWRRLDELSAYIRFRTGLMLRDLR